MHILVQYLPIAISLLSLVISAAVAVSTYFTKKLELRLGRERDVHAWASKIAESYVALASGEEKDKQVAAERLSALANLGRLYFPNDKTVNGVVVGPNGYRSGILDPLIETCRRIADSNDWSVPKLHDDYKEFTMQLARRTTAFSVRTSPEAAGHTQYRNP